MILYPFDNIYPIYKKDYPKQTYINGINSSLWKILEPFLKTIDNRNKIKESLNFIIDKYKYYSLYEFIYLNKNKNFTPIYTINISNYIDNNYLTTIINLLDFKNRREYIKGWFDTNNNNICYFESEDALKFYYFFLD
ncbi:hypothetical protein V6O07_02845 [Arthrospira platensis SPKY2]